ncbi:Permease of the drug/metabolite transporter (DMT) superfamily [Myxococcus hansupus]|uniref:Permease of the drug/metabolite transporter (DMT) superfamily n=1 Tax=Pseudomyxococcus hansupus TaxID=1297742 RepID=A0A0H4WLB8_9BACT|nr:DoxX family membrane protein [Myxococcus hansupus]AKQ63494.1 Permease of the drug/metabolite transporter (DMT) superfamily [Myxococcus hansupus]
MSFAIILVSFFALLHLPPLRRRPALSSPRDRAAVAAGLFFVGAGVMHFVMPAKYAAMIPPQLPSPDFWVFLSGVAEVAGGLGLLLPRTRRLAALGLIVLLLAILPANLHEAQANTASHVLPFPDGYFWLRLPFQLVYIAWVAWAGGPWRVGGRARVVAHG